MTVLVLERYPVDPSNVSGFEELAAARVGELRGADGNLWADLLRGGDDAPSFVLASEWRTEADAEAIGSNGEAFDAVLRGEVVVRRFTS